MANIKLAFLGSEKSHTEGIELMCYKNTSEEIFISINVPEYTSTFICLDKDTAIKLHRELKKQISFIESEVNNG